MYPEDTLIPEEPVRKYKGGLDVRKISIALLTALLVSASGVGIGYVINHLAYEISDEYYVKHLFQYFEFMTMKHTFLPDVPSVLITDIAWEASLIPSVGSGILIGIFSLRLEHWRMILKTGIKMWLFSLAILLLVSLVCTVYGYLLPAWSWVRHVYPMPVADVRRFVAAGSLLQGALIGGLASIAYAHYYSRKLMLKKKRIFF